MATAAQKEEAEKFKEQGNEALKKGDFEEAKKQYNKSIQLDPDNHVYYSNRAAAHDKLGNYDSALADADRCISKSPNFVKAYSRKGKALSDLGRLGEAEDAYKQGLEIDSNNEACKSGLQDVKKKRSRPTSSSSGGFAGFSGFGGSGGGFLQKVMERFKSGGRMQTYMMVMAAYMAFNHFTGRNSTTKTTDTSSGPQVYDDDDDDSTSSGGQTGRKFKEFNSMWISYMNAEPESKTDSLLLLLHRTSSSADTEYGSAFPELAKVTASAGYRIVAPDRPCHGFSPCLSGGEPVDASKWLTPLMRLGGTPDKLAVVAAGREAAKQAISLASKSGKADFTHLVVVSPKSLAPAARITKSAEMQDWLDKHTKTLSPQAIADAARWAAAAEHKQADLASLSIDKLPKDLKVTILYGDKDEEDEEFRQALEDKGVDVKTRDLSGDYTIASLLVDEVQQAISPDGAGMDRDDD